jgi:hypothetical protein
MFRNFNGPENGNEKGAPTLVLVTVICLTIVSFAMWAN